MSQRKVSIVTDSTCDIPQDLIKKYSIAVVPQIVIWGDQEYRDRVTIQPEEFYRRMVSDPVRPSSAAATIEDFEFTYRELMDHGADEILVLTISSAMSGTYQNAVKAAERMKIPLKVVDARGPTMSLGWQVLAAAEEREKGGDLDAMFQRATLLRQTLTQIVGMESIEYLQYGGRIGGAAKWIGSMLHVRPVIWINHASGLVEPAGLTRTHAQMVEMVYQKFVEKIGSGGKMHIAVLHGNDFPEAEKLAARVRQGLNPAELIINITGPVLGINTGPRALALCGYRE
jgi:DegV family protein with EDD domain